MQDEKVNIWADAGVPGLILGAVSIAYLVLNSLMGGLAGSGITAFLIGTLTFLVWAGKIFLLLRCSSSASLVALPMQTKRTPVARGSSVPACPTFRFFLPKCLQAAYFILRITSADVHLYGLSTGRMIPCG